MSSKKDKDAMLAAEARAWANGELDPKDWQDAPETIPRYGDSVPISIRIPKKLLTILKEFAAREGIGYQVLMKKWLDDRVRQEALRVQRKRRQIGQSSGSPEDDLARAKVIMMAFLLGEASEQSVWRRQK